MGFISWLLGRKQPSAALEIHISLSNEDKFVNLIRENGMASQEEFAELFPTYYARRNCIKELALKGITIKKDQRPRLEKGRFTGTSITYFISA